MTKSELVMLVYRSLPYSEQITELDLDSEAEAIRFHWRAQSFRVSTDMFVETVGDGVLSGDDISIIFQGLLQRAFVDDRQPAKAVAS